MRNPVLSGRIAAALAAVVAVAAWMLPNLKARVAAPAPAFSGGGLGVEDPPVTRVYFKAPISAEAAAVWIKLQKKVPMKLDGETPLEDFLNKIKVATADKDEPDGLMFYVDPVGLVESEKTMSSPVTLNLANVRIETALRLARKQLELTFRVHPDGLVLITSTSSNEEEEPEAMILNRLDALQKQVKELRVLVSPSPVTMPDGQSAKK